jgi:hypothetical protein
MRSRDKKRFTSSDCITSENFIARIAVRVTAEAASSSKTRTASTATFSWRRRGKYAQRNRQASSDMGAASQEGPTSDSSSRRVMRSRFRSARVMLHWDVTPARKAVIVSGDRERERG